MELQSLLKNLDISQNKRIIFAGDFSIFFNLKLEIKGGKPLLKRKSIAKSVEIKQNLGICNIWGIISTNAQNFTFRQNHSTGFIKSLLDYIFISNCLQEFVDKTDILPALSTAHSPLLISLLSGKSNKNGNGFWKVNISLVYDKVCVEEMKTIITKINNSSKFMENGQTKWKLLKHEIQKFTIDYSKTIAKKSKKQRINLELKLKNLERNLKL